MCCCAHYSTVLNLGAMSQGCVLLRPLLHGPQSRGDEPGLSLLPFFLINAAVCDDLARFLESLPSPLSLAGLWLASAGPVYDRVHICVVCHITYLLHRAVEIGTMSPPSLIAT